jgi:hypothetical protein
MAAKKTSKKSSKKGPKAEFGAKAEFIRKYPDLSASEVVAKAAEANLSLTSNHVYNTRALDKKSPGKGRSAAKTSGPAKKTKPRTQSRPSSGSSDTNSGSEAALRKAVAEIGLNRARAVFAEVEAAIRGL